MSHIWQRNHKLTFGVNRLQGKAMIGTGSDNEQKKVQSFSQKVQRIRLFSQNHSSGLPRSCYVQRLPWGGRIMIYNADYLQSLLLRGVVEIFVLSLKKNNLSGC